MASRADVEDYAQSNRDIRRIVLADLTTFWAGLDTLNATATRDALLEYVPLLVAAYGEVAAAVAADFYDRMRQASAARGGFSAVLGPPIDVEELRGQIRWAIDPLFSRNPDPAAALGRLKIKADEFTLQPGRDTIAASTGRDPARARWARVPVGKTCAFCLTLASRGPVYESEKSARYKSSGGKYHGDCDCTPVPVWHGDPMPDGYDPDAMYQQYADARDAAGSYKLKPILSELRDQQGLAH